MKTTIEFDDANLTQLLKTVFFGAWMKNATKTAEERDPSMDSFVQYVLGMAWNSGEKARIRVNDEGLYAFAPDLEDVLFEQVDEYDQDIFWDELTDQLARRDYYQKNPSKIGKVPEGKAAEDLVTAIEREQDKYDKEFEERGVERLRIVR
jgi:hypothetical protein